MGLINCHECKNEISDRADFCPRCGAKPRKSVGPLGIVFAGMLGLAAYQCASPRNPPAPQQEQAINKPVTAEQAAAKKLADEDNARFRAARNAVRALRKSLKDPESLSVETIGVSQDATITCILFRAKNSFNATVPDGYVFDGSMGSTRADAVKKLCDPKKNKFFDLTNAK